MTCSFCLGGLATPYVLQNSSFGFKRALTRPRKTLRLATIRQTFVAFCPSVARDQRAPVPRHGRRHSRKFIHFRLPDPPPPPHLPKAAASRLIEGGAGESEALPGTALLRPFYRLGAGVAGRASPGRVGGGGGLGREALVRRPGRAVHGGEGRQRSAHRFLVLPVRSEAPPAEPRPGPSPPPGAIGGCRARPGRRPLGGLLVAAAVREERARCRRFLLHGGRKAARPGERERAGPRRRRRRCGSPSLPQWGWAAERAGRGKGQAPPPLWAME